MRWLFGLALYTSLAGAQGFVVNLNQAGQFRHWVLSPPDPNVHTNVLNPGTGAIRYFLASDAYSATNQTAELNAIRAAFAQWQAVPGTVLKFEEAGLVAPGVDIDVLDNTNVVFWAKDSTLVNGGLDSIANSLAFTYTSMFENNVLAEVDTVFNGVDFRWFTDYEADPTASYFVEGVMLHEVGHWIGLDHSPLGGATMFTRGNPGQNSQTGLSTDELTAVQALYPAPVTIPQLASLRGQVSLNGQPVFGAAVIAEDPTGTAVAGTVTRTNGVYEFAGLPPGAYQARVTPLDPPGAASFLIKGVNISFDPVNYGLAETRFQPTTNSSLTLTAGNTGQLDFTLSALQSAFYISRIRPPVANPELRVTFNAPVRISPGQSNLFVGVYSPSLPASGTSLNITGDGLTLGAATILPNAATDGTVPLHLISVPISVASNATPGLRTFILTSESNLAYANGFLDVQPLVPDFNLDTLDDRFQRHYFPLFTAPEAGPNADPDNDGFTNVREYLAGSSPTDPASVFFRITRILRSESATTVVFESGPGKIYQLLRRNNLTSESWALVGQPAPALSESSQLSDPTAPATASFYRVDWLPEP